MQFASHGFYGDDSQLLRSVVRPMRENEPPANCQLKRSPFCVHQVGVADLKRVGSETIKLIKGELAIR